jgi:large subunit ribosomal protein L1
LKGQRDAEHRQGGQDLAQAARGHRQGENAGSDGRRDLDAAVRTIAGSARSMGVDVEGLYMPAVAKRTKTWKEKLPPGKSYPIDEALKLVKEFATAKFNESVDVSVNLGVDATKSDQQVRGSTVMPHGTGKTVRVAVFTQGKNADAAKAAGADIVGFEDLAEKVKAGQIDFDVVIASPDAMRIVGQLGQILGPRGLMPNPKVGTVTPERRGGGEERQVRPGALPHRQGGHRARADRPGEFRADALKENLLALVADLQKIKPATSKGIYLKKHDRVLDHGSGRRGGSVESGFVVISGRTGRRDPVESCAQAHEAGGGLRKAVEGCERNHRRRPQARQGLLKRPLKDRLRRWWDPNQEFPGEGRTEESTTAYSRVGRSDGVLLVCDASFRGPIWHSS